MKNLEINVNDEIKVFDVLIEAIEFIAEQIRKWFDSDQTEPFNISISKKDGRAPPLKINVNDGIGTRSGLV